MDYGYEGAAVFPFELKLRWDAARASNFEWRWAGKKAGHALKGSCPLAGFREVCVPGKAFLGLSLPGTLIRMRKLPQALLLRQYKRTDRTSAGDAVLVSGTKDHLALKIEMGERESGAEFYPLDEDALRNAAEQRTEPNAKGVVLTVERGDISDTWPARLKGVVKLSRNRAYLIDMPVQPASVAPSGSGTSSTSFALAVLLALTGAWC